MPQRAASLVWGIVGLIAVTGFVLVGIDAARAAGRGPMWKRRLLGAGLVLLAAFGFSSCSKTETQTASPPSVEQLATMPLEETPEWKGVAAAWAEGSAVASWQRGRYPFDKRGKERLLAELRKASADIKRLSEARLLGESEAKLLSIALSDVVAGVQATRTTEEREFTCYLPGRMGMDVADGMERLSARLALLQDMVASDRIAPAAATKILEAIERDILAVRTEEPDSVLRPADRAMARTLGAAAAVDVMKLKARIHAVEFPLEDTAAWKTVVDAWRYVSPMAETGRSTMREREAARQKANAAKSAIAALLASGYLSAAEAGLLTAETDMLFARADAAEPTDRMATCYDRAVVYVEGDRLERLSKRLPLLQRLAESFTVHRSVLEKVLPAVERDLELLTDAKSMAAMQPAERERAEAVSRDVTAALAEIRKTIGEHR